MIIHETHSFKKSLKKLTKNQKLSLAKALRTFKADPFDPSLLNHKLKGKQKWLRSFSAEHDLRIIYKAEGGHAIVFLLKAGTHEQVYK